MKTSPRVKKHFGISGLSREVLSLALLVLTALCAKADLVQYNLRDNVFSALTYSASGANWEEVHLYYRPTANGWADPTPYGAFERSYLTSGDISRPSILAHPANAGATVGEYVVKGLRRIETYYGLHGPSPHNYGNVRFVIQIKRGSQFQTVLDSVVHDYNGWRYFSQTVDNPSNDDVLVRFITDPNGSTWEDWAGWAEPKLYLDSQTSGTTEPELPYRIWNGHFYHVVLAPGISWPEAYSKSESSSYAGQKGHLVTITSAEEDQFVESLRSQAFAVRCQWLGLPIDETSNQQLFWAGGFQVPIYGDAKRGWRWVNNEGAIATTVEPGSYSHWAGPSGTEPNDCCNGIEDGQQNYLALGLHFYGTNLKGWDDSEEDGNWWICGYVVEYEPATCASLPELPAQTWNGHVYKAVLAPGISWVEANAAAQNSEFAGLRGHLVTITSAEEHEFVESLRMQAFVELRHHLNLPTEGLINEQLFWAGGYQLPNQQHPQLGWRWVNDEGPIGTSANPVGLSHWAGLDGREPNDDGATTCAEDSEQDFLCLGLHVYGENLKGWDDSWGGGGSWLCGYIIEYEARVETALPEMPFHTWNGHTYRAVLAPRTSWPEAQWAAVQSEYQGMQGHLVTITSAQENDVVESVRSEAFLALRQHLGLTTQGLIQEQLFWAGGFQLPGQTDPKLGWRWVNNDGPIPPSSTEGTYYAHWAGHEPNDENGVEDAQQSFLALGLQGDPCGWDDSSGEGTSWLCGYIIEYDKPNTAPTGALLGLVTGNGLPVSGAQVSVEHTGSGATTTANGSFTLLNVPTGYGYIVTVGAPGYAPRKLAGVVVRTGINDLGTIELNRISGPFQVQRLVPEVNPPVSEVEEGGTAYRYYQVVGQGAVAAPGVQVSLQRIDGAAIDQSGDVMPGWPGVIAGISDSAGIVRLRIPASVLDPGNSTFQVIAFGQVQQEFEARSKPRSFDQLWSHRMGAEVSASWAVLKASGAQAFETVVRDEWRGNELINEFITRQQEKEAKLGVEVSTPGIKLGSVARAGTSAGGGILFGINGGSTFRFDAGSTDRIENAQKLYVALGDPLLSSTDFSRSIYEAFKSSFEPRLLGDKLAASDGALQLGGYFDAEAQLKLLSFGDYGLKVGAQISGEAYIMFGSETSHGENRTSTADDEMALVIGLGTELSFDVGLSYGARHYFSNPAVRGLGLFVDAAHSSLLAAKVWTPAGGRNPTRVELAVEQELSAGVNLDLIGWKGLQNGGSLIDAKVGLKEVFSYNLPSPEAFTRFSAFGPAWDMFKTGVKAELRGTVGEDLLGGILEAPALAGQALDYERRVYIGRPHVFDMIDGGLKGSIGIASLGLEVEVSAEEGAEAVSERGKIWQSTRMPTELYPDDIVGKIPNNLILEKEYAWFECAMPEIAGIINAVSEVVDFVWDNSVQAGGAVVEFAGDAWETGTEIISTFVSRQVSGTTSTVRILDVLGPTPDFLPQPDNTNWVYGVSGIYRFYSTNTFTGVAKLTIPYTDAEVEGLDEAALQIYRLNESNNRWELVGGTVDAVLNKVTVSITNLGTYAIAPPMPAGLLSLQPTPSVLNADGVSELILTATNILLNTGTSATQHWLFTVAAVGVQLLNEDADASLPGLQVVSTDAALSLHLRAPFAGTNASVSLVSVAGNARGQLQINLVDNVAPQTPQEIIATAGQSRIWVSWKTNSDLEPISYRVYYRQGKTGPPWDGTAAVEGVASPVSAAGTNVLLRGLELGTNYWVSVSATDAAGNESPLGTPVNVTTVEGAPAAPSGVSVRFGQDGTNMLMWALSEDDGYNDRDVVSYRVWRAVMPVLEWVLVGQVATGSGLFSETNTPVGPEQYIRYGVQAVDSGGLTSERCLANRVMASGTGVDNDGDSVGDWWTSQYFGHPIGQASDNSLAQDDADQDGLTNLQEYQLGRNPLIADNAWVMSGAVKTPRGAALRGVSLEALASSVTAADGSYNGIFTYGWSGTVSPMKADDTPPANGVTVADLALIQRHILGMGALDSPYKLLAADVNGSKTLTVADLALIQRLVLGITNRFPTGLWRFVPADYSFPDALNPWNAPTNRCYTNLVADTSAQDFIAVKLGDVNNTWQRPILAAKAIAHTDTFDEGSPKIGFPAGGLIGAPGERVKANVVASNFRGVTSVQGTLMWDPAVLRFVATGDYGLDGLSGEGFGLQEGENGKLTFGWFDGKAVGVSLDEGATMFSVSFEVIGAPGSESPLRFGDAPTGREVGVEFERAACQFVGGSVTVGTGEPLRMLDMASHDGAFHLSVKTQKGHRYVLEYTPSLPATSWTPLTAVDGDGMVNLLVDRTATNHQRFYRVRRE